MRDVSFYEVIISKEDQRIVSADPQFCDLLGSNAVKPMNELIATEDIDIYENNIKNCDGNWYPSKILSPDNMYYCYVRAESYSDELIRVTVVNAHDLLNAHYNLMMAINAANAQLSLYEDVFFEYCPEKDIVSVYNTELVDFDTGDYSLSEFEDLLLVRADEDQKQEVRNFIAQVKAGVGRSTSIIEGNILNDDDNVTNTVLEESFVFYNKGSEGVVGHLQLRRGKEAIRSSFIKHDSLTGLIDKTDIIKIARERIDDRRLETTLVILDADFFKSINDNYGHQFGDEVIKKIADIISSCVEKDGLAGRFGGDEFFIVLYNMQSEDRLRVLLRDIKSKVRSTFPDKGLDRDNPLSVSIGTASYPKDADNYDDLFMLADHCLYLAKEKGRNRYIIYSKEKHGTLEEIRLKHQSSKIINDRENSLGDVIVKMLDFAMHDKSRPVESYMSDFAEAFELQNVSLYVGSPFEFKCISGSKAIKDEKAIEFVLGVLNSEDEDKYFTLGDFVVINRLETLPPHAFGIRDFLEKRDVYSLIIIRFYDRDKKECILIISSVGNKKQWNQGHFKYYRAFVDILSLFSL